jgi:beta-alanine--pyruvate transaminase
MPFTNNRYFKDNPRLLVAAKGMYYTSSDGRRLLDATSGLWCVNAGHGRAAIGAAVAEAVGTLDFAPTFQLGHPLPFRLASELAKIMPAGLDRVFFTNSGSESADTALKMALAYHHARGDQTRFRLIGRQRGYHGTNFGGLSVGGLGGNRRRFVSQVWGGSPFAHAGQAVRFQRGLQPGNGALADELEDLVALHGAETIAAVIVEPMAGSAGCWCPHRAISSACARSRSKHGILLIFDEVITGFGRLGAATGAELFGVTPDIITLAKGLTNATVPMGAVVASREVHDAIVEGSPEASSSIMATPIRAIRWRRQRGWPRCRSIARKGCLPARARWRPSGKRRSTALPIALMWSTSATWALSRGSNWPRAMARPVPAQPKCSRRRSTVAC